jgi:hypothetical protein
MNSVYINIHNPNNITFEKFNVVGWNNREIKRKTNCYIVGT